MWSFFEKKGDPIAYSKTKKKWFGIGDAKSKKLKNHKGYKEIKLPDAQFSLMPSKNKERTTVYIAGPDGCGKTKFAMDFMKNYAKLFPNRLMIVITPDPEDKTIKEANIANLKVIPMDSELLQEKEFYNVELYQQSCIFLDDIDYVDNPSLKKRLKELCKNLLGLGRHHETSVIISSHVITDYQRTRFLLSLINYVVIFPRGGSNYFTDTFLKRYFSAAKKRHIDRALRSGSRWLCCRMFYPQLILLEDQIYFL